MPRAKQTHIAEQVYNLPQYGRHAKVTITYDADNPPPFYQPAPGVVIVGEHSDVVAAPAARQPPAESEGTEGGATLDDVMRFRQSREVPRPQPLTSEAAAIQRGFDPNIVSFDNLSGVVAGLPALEESLVE